MREPDVRCRCCGADDGITGCAERAALAALPVLLAKAHPWVHDASEVAAAAWRIGLAFEAERERLLKEREK